MFPPKQTRMPSITSEISIIKLQIKKSKVDRGEKKKERRKKYAYHSPTRAKTIIYD